MKQFFTSFVIVLLFCSNFFTQQQDAVEKYAKVRITIHNRSDLQKLQLAGLSLEGMKVEANSLDLILSDREIIKLNELGFSYETLIDDLTKYYQERSRRTETEIKNLEREMKKKFRSGGFGFGSMGGYYTFDEVIAELDTMRMLYPNIITAKYSIGTTLEGRTIWAVKISDNPDVTEGEPEVFYNALIHAREPAAMMAVIYFMYHLLENYSSDPEITYLVDNRELFFVPVINVDGYEYNHQMAPNGGYMWRKNKRDNNLNGTFEEGYDGVDLNRNFGYMWGYNNIGSSPDPSSELYRGTAPFSEPEIQVIRDFCNIRDFNLALNYHTYGNLLLYSWGYINTPTPDDDWFAECSSLMVVFNGYEAGQSPLVLYEVNGSADDWMYGEQVTKPKIFSMTPEVGNDNDGFWPIPERIFPLASENCYPNKVLAWGIGVIDDPPHITEGSLNSTYYVPAVDSVHITAVESNPENFNRIVTASLYDLNDNLIDEFEMSEISANNFYSSFLAPQEENFYYFLLKDSCSQLPSNFYYKENLKFTTAGPLVVDSLLFLKGSTDYYNVKPFLKNNGSSLTITNAKMRLYCDDPWVTSVSATTLSFSSIAPGATVGANTWVAVSYNPATFPGYFNLRAEISRDEYVYWIDSTQLIVTGVEDETPLPTEYVLEQNYPNPFNPGTVISYQMPVGGNVMLKVYDVLGNEIATLVDEYKPAGKYEVEFNASTLPSRSGSSLTSGVYFYQLYAGDPSTSSGQGYTAVKKMILLK